MKIIKTDRDKKRYLELLLLGDEQESMIDRYLEREICMFCRRRERLRESVW